MGREKEEQAVEQVVDQRARTLRVLGGTALIVGTLLLFLSLVSYSRHDPPNSDYPLNSRVANLCGVVGAWVAGITVQYLGRLTSFMLVLLGGVWIYLFFSRRELEHAWLKLLGLTCFVASAAGLFAWLDAATGNGPSAGLRGGFLGQAITNVLLQYFAHWGTLILLLAFAVLSLFLATDMLLWNWLAVGTTALKRAWDHARGRVPQLEPALETVGAIPTRPVEPKRPARKSRKNEREADSDQAEGELADELSPEESQTVPRRAAVESVPEPEPEPESASEAEPSGHLVSAEALEDEGQSEVEVPVIEEQESQSRPDYVMPSLDLLEDAEPIDQSRYQSLVQEKATVLERCLGEFGIRVRVVEIETGPVITMYELELAPGIKVGRLLGLTDDIAMALKAPSVRIVAPIPGKSTVGVEVPNVDKENVRLRDVLIQGAAMDRKFALPIYIGKDASGMPLVFDLAQLPHLLIAGETGSGKSVCISALILSLLMTRRPDEVRLLLVDPKMVELQSYHDMPHLLTPVVTDMKKAAGILKWAEQKMDDRYEHLSAVNVRNIRSFNALGEEEIRHRLQIDPDEPLESIEIPFHLPYIVIVIDELADLMMLAAKDVEISVIRLAQKSRAVGIHIVLATQRPSVDVVTGLIKSNMPARISFRLLSKVDSRTILDQNGAEKLLGRGDMLFVQPGTSKLVRAQGTYVSDEEIRSVVEYLKAQARPSYSAELGEVSLAENPTGYKEDELYDAAIKVVVSNQRGSVSLLQRKLEIGYSRAARLIDMMAEDGIVGTYKGSQAREVLMSLDAWEKWRASHDEKKE